MKNKWLRLVFYLFVGFCFFFTAGALVTHKTNTFSLWVIAFILVVDGLRIIMEDGITPLLEQKLLEQIKKLLEEEN